MSDRSYLGKGWGFPVSFTRQEGAVMTSDEEDIRQSLYILLSTVPGERLFTPKYGCRLNQWVFSIIDISEKTRIRKEIEAAVLEGEPRIDLEEVEVEVRDEQEEVLLIHLHYRVRQTNSRSNIVYPFYLREGTHL